MAGEGKNADRVTEAYRELRRLILFHRLAPGTPIIQTRLADDLGQSRVTVRAALQRLAQEGYVVETELGTYSRFVVTALTVPDMQELWAIVGAVEGVAARECAQLPPDVRVKLADRMDAVNRSVMAMVEEGRIEPQEARRLDVRFHRIFVEQVKGPRLLTLLDSMKPQIERYRDLYVARIAGKMRTLGVPERQEIADAIRAGDADRSQRAVEEHWRAGAARLRRVMEEIDEDRRYSWG